MIEYKTGKWNLAFIWRYKGSVFPRAISFATPAAILAAIICEVVKQIEPNHSWRLTDEELKNGMSLWSGYVFVLGFLLVFRTQQAYSRFWEGSTLLQEVRGEWFNCTSSLFAFCTAKPERKKEVLRFQQLLVRLMSMLYCAALQTVYRDSQGSSEVCFEIVDPEGLDEQVLYFLDDTPEQIEVLVQWIQRLIVDNMGTGILPIPPPVITRAFQELSRGVVHLHNARKITDIAFPFPYAQMMSVLLLFHTLSVPLFAGILVPQAMWASLLTFVSVSVFWGINYIASEIEFPFGNDYNDLPMSGMTADMNQSLITLLDPRAQNPPAYNGSHSPKPGTLPVEPASGEKTVFRKGKEGKETLRSATKNRLSFARTLSEPRSSVAVARMQSDGKIDVIGQAQRQQSAVESPPATTSSVAPVLEPKHTELFSFGESLEQLGVRIEDLVSQILDKLNHLVEQVVSASIHLKSVDAQKADEEATTFLRNPSRVRKKLKSSGSCRSTSGEAVLPTNKTDNPKPIYIPSTTSIFSDAEDESETQGFLPSSRLGSITDNASQVSAQLDKNRAF